MRLIQLETPEGRAVARIEGNQAIIVPGVVRMVDLAQKAISTNKALAEIVRSLGDGKSLDYPKLLAAGHVLPPLDHPDPAHCLVTGTGLTHLGSADTRDKMHQKLAGEVEALTDSMKMFKLGLDGGKPDRGPGVQPEWFYKGDGSTVVRPNGDLPLPDFALDGGEEPEIAGLYVIAPNGQPWRLGFALGNEYSDHIMERQNYLYLAHSKLRSCAVGPEVLVGPLPHHLSGESRVVRDGQVIWRKPFLSGERNMSHAIANLEYHHFKYDLFRRPGDAHIHFFGTATLSFADGIRPEAGDSFEIEMADFGAPLRNRLVPQHGEFAYGGVKPL